MEKYFCPVNGWDCPYYTKNGSCKLENPVKECDDAAFFEEDGMLIIESNN